MNPSWKTMSKGIEGFLRAQEGDLKAWKHVIQSIKKRSYREAEDEGCYVTEIIASLHTHYWHSLDYLIRTTYGYGPKLGLYGEEIQHHGVTFVNRGYSGSEDDISLYITASPVVEVKEIGFIESISNLMGAE